MRKDLNKNLGMNLMIREISLEFVFSHLFLFFIFLT